MDEIKRFSALIEQIYAAAADPNCYTPLAGELARYFGVGSAVVQTRGRVDGSANLVSTTNNFSVRSLNEYGEHYYKVDEWVLRGGQIKAGDVFQGSELIPFNEFENSECYVDYGRHLGLYDCLAAVFPTEEGVCAFGIHRSKTEREFDQSAKLQMELLTPHLRNSLNLAMQIQEALGRSNTLAQGLDLLSVAVIIVDANKRIRFASKKAESFLSGKIGLVSRKSKLIAVDPGTDDKLTRAIRMATSVEAGGSMNLITKEGGFSISLKIMPAPREAFQFLEQGRFAAIFLASESDHLDPSLVLRETFKLTPAELRLVEGLLAGCTLRSYAEQNNKSIDTAKSQLKSIFSKTDTNSQSELIMLLNKNPLFRMKVL